MTSFSLDFQDMPGARFTAFAKASATDLSGKKVLWHCCYTPGKALKQVPHLLAKEMLGLKRRNPVTGFGDPIRFMRGPRWLQYCRVRVRVTLMLVFPQLWR